MSINDKNLPFVRPGSDGYDAIAPLAKNPFVRPVAKKPFVRPGSDGYDAIAPLATKPSTSNTKANDAKVSLKEVSLFGKNNTSEKSNELEEQIASFKLKF